MARTPKLYERVQIVRNNEPCVLSEKVNAAFKDAVNKTDIDGSRGIYTITGMSGKKYRYFMNNFIRSLPDPRYLEIGSWAGSTLCSVVHDNKVRSVAIDNWSLFGGPKKEFTKNVTRYRSPDASVSIFEADFRDVDYTKMGHTFNVYLFDGPHEKQDQYDGLAMVLPCLDNRFVFIVDDWNWKPVQDGTFEAISACDLQIIYAASVLTSPDGTQPEHNIGPKSNWHNGYFISVLEKKA